MLTGNTNTASRYESSNCLTVAVVLLSQVASRVQCKLVCGTHTGCTQLATKIIYLCSTPLRTIQSDDASRSGEDAHSPDILLPQSVLHTGYDRAYSRCLEGRTRCIRDGIPRVEGGLLVGHGGRIGRRCLSKSSPNVDEVGSSRLGEQSALSRKHATCIIGRNCVLVCCT
jgi:hypothetical protein